MDIVLALWLLFVASAALILVLVSRAEKHQKIGVEAATSLLLSSLPFLFVFELPLGPLLIIESLHIILLVLAVRVWVRRLEPAFLKNSTLVNVTLDTIIMAISILAILWAVRHNYGHEMLSVILALDVIVVVAFIGQLLWNVGHFRLKLPKEPMAMSEMPTVSICIPARNEDQSLSDCLQSAIASDYPKLEFLVLDDCSQDTTSTVIKSFAHQGVRFVQGNEPATGWLGKNQAQNTLAAQASGDLILFLGVDTKLEVQTVSRMVAYMIVHRLSMLSVLSQDTRGPELATLFSTLQYFRRIVWPITKHQVPVSSKAWMISAGALRSLGGFASVRHKVVPEVSFARRLQTQLKYRFLVSNKELGLTSHKSWKEQIQTAIRLLYPSDRRQPLLAWLHVLEVVFLMIVPVIITASAIWHGRYEALEWLSIAVCVLFTLCYYMVLIRTHPKSWWLAGLLWPLVAVQEVILVVASMLLYEFSEVDWKGRNVCYAVLNLPPKPISGPVLKP